MLPTSLTILDHDELRIVDKHVDAGGFADVWKGTFKNKEVTVKSLRVCQKDDSSIIRRVCCRYHLLLLFATDRTDRNSARK